MNSTHVYAFFVFCSLYLVPFLLFMVLPISVHDFLIVSSQLLSSARSWKFRKTLSAILYFFLLFILILAMPDWYYLVVVLVFHSHNVFVFQVALECLMKHIRTFQLEKNLLTITPCSINLFSVLYVEGLVLCEQKAWC